MFSIHNVKSIKLTEPKQNGEIFTNELLIDDGKMTYQIDLFSKDKHCLRITSEQVQSLKSIFKELILSEN